MSTPDLGGRRRPRSQPSSPTLANAVFAALPGSERAARPVPGRHCLRRRCRAARQWHRLRWPAPACRRLRASPRPAPCGAGRRRCPSRARRRRRCRCSRPRLADAPAPGRARRADHRGRDCAALPHSLGRRDVADPGRGAGPSCRPRRARAPAPDAALYFLERPRCRRHRRARLDAAHASVPAAAVPSALAGVPHPPVRIGLRPALQQFRADQMPNLDLGLRPFDPRAVRRDFPILQQQIHGRPLVWLDNGATTQKPQAVIDRLSHFYEHENSNIHRGAHTLAARSTDAYEDARDKVRASSSAGDPHEIVFVRGTTEGINLVAQVWGRANIGGRRRDRRSPGSSTTPTSCRGSSSAPSPARGCASRRSTTPARSSSTEFERLLGPRTKLVAITAGVERARHRDAGRRDDRGCAPRTAPACWSTARSRCRTCRSTCRRSTATSSCSPATRCSGRPASACCTAGARSWRPCRPGRAAAT